MSTELAYSPSRCNTIPTDWRAHATSMVPVNHRAFRKSSDEAHAGGGKWGPSVDAHEVVCEDKGLMPLVVWLLNM
ncbi:unnamed protein product, partial [Nesidiocoris tenuis]